MTSPQPTQLPLTKQSQQSPITQTLIENEYLDFSNYSQIPFKNKVLLISVEDTE